MAEDYVWPGLPVGGITGGRVIDWGSVPGQLRDAGGRLQTVYRGRALDYEGRLMWRTSADCYEVTDLGGGQVYGVVIGRSVMGCTCGMQLIPHLLMTAPCRHVLAAFRMRNLERAAYGQALWC